MSEPVESLYFGNYEVLQRPGGGHWLLGEGGYGRTYKAEHQFLRRVCALKIIHERHMRNDRQRGRFLHEAQTAARLYHPGIAHVYDFGEHEGMFFYAMEFCEGGNLDELSKLRGPMPWSEVAAFAAQVGDALACAHEAGLLHRDLKPQNVMLASPQGPPTAKLIDFGLVKVMESVENDSTWAIQSVEGGFKGNYATASPEQTGEDENLDERSDLFSLGVILWWLLIGHNPFEGMSNPRLIADRLSSESYEPRLPPELDDSARGVLGKLLEKRPDDRFSSGRDLLVALAGSGVELAPPPVPEEEAREEPPVVLPPPPLPEEEPALPTGRLSFEDSFEVVATVEDLQAAKLYECHDASGQSYTAMIPDPEAAPESLECLARAGGSGARFPCFDYYGEWRAEEGGPVYLFGAIGSLRLLEVLKILGSGRLVDLAPMLGRLARTIDQCERQIGLGVELNPHSLRVGVASGAAKPGSWLDVDQASLRTVPSLPSSGDDSADVSDASTIVTEESMFPVVSQFAALIYRLVSGTAVKHSAYFSSAAYVPAAALSEDGNQLLEGVISGELEESGVLDMLRNLAPLEGLSIDVFGLDEAPPEGALAVPLPVAAARLEAERMARAEAERLAREEAERKVREEAERKVREEAERKAREEAEIQAKLEAERRAKEEAERKIREEEERKVREEAERKAREEAEKQAKQEAERLAKEEAERKIREEEERKVREEAERKARKEAEKQAKLEAERLAKEEAERKIREEAERKVREEEERKARVEAEKQAKEAARLKAIADAKLSKQQRAEQKAREEAERKAREEAERKAQEEAERKAREAKEAAERKAIEDARRAEQEKAEQKAREEAARQAKEEAERKAKEKAELKAQHDAERKARKEAEHKAKEEAKRKKAEEHAKLKAEKAKKKAVPLTPVAADSGAAGSGTKSSGKRLGWWIGGGIAAVLALSVGTSMVLKAIKGKEDPQPKAPVVNNGNGQGNGGPANGKEVEFTHLEKLRLPSGLKLDQDVRILAVSTKSGKEAGARWSDAKKKFFFDGAIVDGSVSVTLRDGLAFEDLWSADGAVVNQRKGRAKQLELGEVRRVFGVKVPEVVLDPPSGAESVVRVEQGDGNLPCQLVSVEGAATKRAVWLGSFDEAPAGEPKFAARTAGDASAAEMPAGVELVMEAAGYREKRYRAGDQIPDQFTLKAMAVLVTVGLDAGAAGGYPYESVSFRPVAGEAPEKPTCTLEELRKGKQVSLGSGSFQIEFRGARPGKQDQLLASLVIVVPGSCEEEGELRLPASLPGLEVRIEGRRLDFGKLEFEPLPGSPAAPAELRYDKADMVVGWADLTVAGDEVDEELNLAGMIQSGESSRRVLLKPVSYSVRPAKSLLTAELLPKFKQYELGTIPTVEQAPVDVKAVFSGVYQSPPGEGIECRDFPENPADAEMLEVSTGKRLELPWWHNLRSYPSLADYFKLWNDKLGKKFPVSTVYVELDLDFSNSAASPFFYALNMETLWTAHWGTLDLGDRGPDAEGWIEKASFNVGHGEWFSTKKFRFKPMDWRGPPKDWTQMMHYSAESKAFRPWWTMYNDWSSSLPAELGAGEPGGWIDLRMTRSGGQPKLSMREFREIFAPPENFWQRALKPKDQLDEIRKAVDQSGGVVSILFTSPQALLPAPGLSRELWKK